MSTNFQFLREYRTPFSEVYSIYIDDNEDVDGRLDVHYLNDNGVTALLCLYKEFSEEDVQVLLEAIDDQIINMTDIENNNLFFEVYTVSNKRGYGLLPKEE